MNAVTCVQRLNQLGYEYEQIVDSDNLAYAIGYVENDILRFCNVSEIPTQAEYLAIDMVCSYFLKSKNEIGAITPEIAAGIVSSIKLGDSNVNFDTDNYTTKFSEILDNLYTVNKNKLVSFRKLRW